MSGDRAPLFDDDDFDVSGFEPKAPPPARPKAERVAVKALAEEAGFQSRDASAIRKQRRHRTGRNRQVNIKMDDEAVALLENMADRTGLVYGELVKQALLRLERQLRDEGAGG